VGESRDRAPRRRRAAELRQKGVTRRRSRGRSKRDRGGDRQARSAAHAPGSADELRRATPAAHARSLARIVDPRAVASEPTRCWRGTASDPRSLGRFRVGRARISSGERFAPSARHGPRGHPPVVIPVV
jgi:hypothetical protein